MGSMIAFSNSLLLQADKIPKHSSRETLADTLRLNELGLVEDGEFKVICDDGKEIRSTPIGAGTGKTLFVQ